MRKETVSADVQRARATVPPAGPGDSPVVGKHRPGGRNLTKQRIADVHECPAAVGGGDQPSALGFFAWFIASQNWCVAIVERSPEVQPAVVNPAGEVFRANLVWVCHERMLR